ncbi:hypothetical protein [Jannaschia faecimaris]|nr:hypothetical protein [Jannaschia faecimaris]
MYSIIDALQIAQDNAKAFSMLSGRPDLRWCRSGGPLRCFEVKAPGNKPTADQLAFRDGIKAVGGLWASIDEIDAIEAQFRTRGYAL